MTALAFDPRAFLKMQDGACPAASPAIPAGWELGDARGIAALAGIAGGHPRTCIFEDADQDVPDGWAADCRAIRDARLPSPGTPERDRLDRDHTRMWAGLLAGYLRHVGGAA